MIVLMNILNLKWMSILIKYWYIYLVRDGFLPSLFLSLLVTLLVTSCHFLSLIIFFLSLIIFILSLLVTSCHFLSLVSLDIYTTFYISVTLYRNWEKRCSLAGAEELSRLGIAIKQVCCSALGSALFDLLVQCGKKKDLVYNNIKGGWKGSHVK